MGAAAVKEILLVACGGAAGALARWKMSGVILHHTVDWRFPISTFIVNAAGCVLAGFIAGLIAKQEMFSPAMRLFLLTGLLGGFTTFSAFGVECMYLMRRGEYGVMCAYAVLSVVAAVGGTALAMMAVPGRAAE
jgi:CrcB protein